MTEEKTHEEALEQLEKAAEEVADLRKKREEKDYQNRPWFAGFQKRLSSKR